MPETGTKADQARRRSERLACIRLRYAINTHLEDQSITSPAAIGTAVGLPATEAVSLLTRRQWREGDAAALRAVADRLGLDVPPGSLDLPPRDGETS